MIWKYNAVIAPHHRHFA